MLVAAQANGQDYAARRERLVGEVDAMYAETERETGLARMSAAVLNLDERIDAYVVESENLESIHNHSAYALIERDKRAR